MQLDWQASAWPLDKVMVMERRLFPGLPGYEDRVAKAPPLRQDGGVVRDGRKAGKVHRPPPLAPAAD